MKGVLRAGLLVVAEILVILLLFVLASRALPLAAPPFPAPTPTVPADIPRDCLLHAGCR